MTISYPAPCAPVIQDHSLDCVYNHALVSWVEDEDAMSVMVNATSSQGHLTSCSSSTNSSCVLEELECGHAYTIQAFARGVQCFSRPSATFQKVTGQLEPVFVIRPHVFSCIIYSSEQSFYFMLSVFLILCSCLKHVFLCVLSEVTVCME